MCETEESVVQGSNPLALPNINPVRRCEPAQGGIISASVKLIDFLENFDETSRRANWIMIILTIVIAFLTVINILLSIGYL
ncbi:hypothetical protein AKJ62_00775 [candidate division MSBL1 archaeon SCGC-AAA259D14]|uniref:Uncharacterized protein n=1 Tax=candidate division MSBL1 archaeon SCGC-AAA259D14 TaxID=1698261 RepID=A0A133U8E8_9EURY|nr:hypothetical protein AKJ62_00775 [candidate division MSBL1 archaeon SCGC-AAA259D14]